MEIISISMVKNESDIIESFIRYNTSVVDKMVILDNGSTDGTLAIINKLIDEGLPVYLIEDPNPAYLQSQIMTRLLHLVLDEFHPAFVIPIDADEFISANDGNPRELINELDGGKIHFIPWATYVPTSQDNKGELFVPKRITRRRVKEPTAYYKVIIPGKLAKKNNLSLTQGNHDVKIIRNIFKNFNHSLFMAHYPVRSRTQIMSKYLVGWLAYLAKPDIIKGEGYHWEEAYFNIKENVEIKEEELTWMAMKFAAGEEEIPNQMVYSPLNLEYIEVNQIIYREEISRSYLKNLLNYSEHLAKEYSRLSRMGSSQFSETEYIKQLRRNKNYRETYLMPSRKNKLSSDYSGLLVKFRKLINYMLLASGTIRRRITWK